MKDGDKPATELLKNDTCNSSSDESDCAGNRNEQEIVNDTNSCSFSYADANVFVNTRLLQNCMNAEDSLRDISVNMKKQNTLMYIYTKVYKNDVHVNMKKNISK